MKDAPQIKTPCPRRWEEMHGGVTTRFCDHCQLHVQNLSAMSPRKIAALLARRESERVCVTYTRAADGSVVTRWQVLRERFLAPARRGFAWGLAALVPIAFGACATQSKGPARGQLTGRVGPRSEAQRKAAEEERVIVTGGI